MHLCVNVAVVRSTILCQQPCVRLMRGATIDIDRSHPISTIHHPDQYNVIVTTTCGQKNSINIFIFFVCLYEISERKCWILSPINLQQLWLCVRKRYYYICVFRWEKYIFTNKITTSITRWNKSLFKQQQVSSYVSMEQMLSGKIIIGNYFTFFFVEIKLVKRFAKWRFEYIFYEL